MTNCGYYADKLLNIWKSGSNFGVVDGIPECCEDISCCKCAFCDEPSASCTCTCKAHRKEWLNDTYMEYETDWSKVPIDTPIKIIRNDKVYRRYYAGLNKYGLPTFYANGRTAYTNCEDRCEVYDEIMLASESDKYKYRKEDE